LKGDSGAALVEAAIVLPLLFVLLFGIIDFGSLYNDYLSVRQGTREGARQAAVSTKPLPASGTWASSGCVTSISAGTNLDGYDLVCFVKNRLGLNQANTRVKVFFVSQGGTKPFAAGQGVTVCVQYPATSVSGYMTPFLNGSVLSSMVEIRIEQDSTWTTPVDEGALTTWSPACGTV
jgi:Flp pilus assembly protein TadG